MRDRHFFSGVRVPGVSWLVRVLFLSATLAAGFPALAADSPDATQEPVPFNHLSTGFALRGAHEYLACESCHLHGVFKGTPTRCSGCHGRITEMEASKKPASHIPTTQECDLCHDASLPNVSWQLARMDHIGIAGNCAACHNNIYAMGKPADHPPTNQPCEDCHGSIDTFADNPKPDHSRFVGNCQRCHNGRDATGKPANHLRTETLPAGATADCVPCHDTVSFASGRFVHEDFGATVGSHTCNSCHNGNILGAEGPAAGRPIHQAIKKQKPETDLRLCDDCHTTAGFGG
jgi:hypothetical protein